MSEFVGNDRAERHPFEQIVHFLEDTLWVIDVLIESLRALLPEPQEPVHVAILVIASQEENLPRVLQFKRQQQANHLETLTSTVDVIAEEDVVEAANIASLLRRSPNVEEPHQAIVVAMQVAEYFDRRLQVLDQHRLLLEDLHDLVDQLDHVLLLDHEGAHHLNRLLAVPRRQQVLYKDRVEGLVLIFLN